MNFTCQKLNKTEKKFFCRTGRLKFKKGILARSLYDNKVKAYTTRCVPVKQYQHSGYVKSMETLLKINTTNYSNEEAIFLKQKFK